MLPDLIETPAVAPSAGFPRTLGEALRARLPGDGALVIVDRAGRETSSSWAEVVERGLRAAGGLGLPRGARVVLALDEPLELLAGFWGCLLAGLVPVPAGTNPRRLAQLRAGLAGAAVLDELRGDAPPAPQVDASPEEVAVVLATSGSTGQPKLVPLTHANVLAGIGGFLAATGYGPGDRSLNWLPLFHVGGLTRSIRDVIAGVPQVQVATARVVADPLEWLELLGRHRATSSWAPNFAFGRVTAALAAQPARRFALDGVRWLWSSGELVVLRTMERFAAALAPHGLRRETLSASWGMTEVCSATVARDLLARPPAGPYASAGVPVPGLGVRIVDGRIEVRGAAVSDGDGWLRTGDLARIEDGALVVTGRAGHVLKRRGVMRSLRDIEETVEASRAVEAGYTVACAVRDEDADTDELALFFHPAGADLAGSLRAVRRALAAELGLRARYLVPLPREAIRGTGVKIDRDALLHRLRSGELGAEVAAASHPSGGAGGDIEARVAAAVAETLDCDAPGRDDNLFEIGADSVAVAHLAAVLAADFPDRPPSPVDLYRLTTVGALADWLSASTPSARERISPVRAQREPTDIAIIGAALRFPGAASPEELWRNLTGAVDSISFFTPDELVAAGVHPRWLAHPDYVPAAGALTGVEDFDAGFFGMSSADADMLDPQQRLLLECAWEALERAGHASRDRRRRTGVFCGTRVSEYLTFNLPIADIIGVTEGSPVAGLARLIANGQDYAATRIAFKLDLQGPAINVHTACSTSLVALHLACKSLLDGECDLALAGGATVRVPHRAGYLHSEGMTFSRDGHTRGFDADASGTLFSSGVGLVLLKRLDRALADRDDVWAVVRGTAVNNDGAVAKAAFSAPSQVGQARVIREALTAARVSADTISYLEAHGTGTGLGDPIEVAGLTDAFRDHTDRRGYCAIGSLKSNVGHMVQASGVGGVVKVALMMRHRELVPHLHYRRANPLIDFEASPFRVVTERRPWSVPDGQPRRAGVSSFGIGGTNAHVVLEEPPPPAPLSFPGAVERPAHLLALSARSETALRGLVERFAERLDGGASLADVCYSANTGRERFAHRLAAVADSPARMRDALRAAAPTRAPDAPPRVAFVFPGQGAQHAGMARGLYQASPVVRDVLDRCDARLRPVLGASLLEVMFGDDGRLDDTLFAQPALLAVELALLALWRSWGVRPAAVLGHSVGEYAAACAAGVLAEDDALVLIAERARAMSSLPRGGAMASVVVAEEKLVEALGGVEVAAWNAPGHVVLSGDAAALEAALAALPGSVVDRLRVSHAFHSRLMEPALPGFAAAAARVAYAPPSLPFFSTVTGARAAAELADAAYWRDQIRRPVRFADAARALAADGCPVWLELGPHPTLLGMARLGELDDHLGVPSLRRGRDDWQTLLTAAGVLHGAGVALDWDGFDAPYPRRRVWLPATPFDKRRHWVEPSRREAEDPDAHPLLGRLLRSPLAARQHQARLTPDRPAFLADHVVHGSVVVPGTAYVEMLVAAFGGPPLEIADLVIERPLRLPPEGRTVQTILEPRAGGGFDARIASLEGERWTTHVTAVLNDGATELAATAPGPCPRELSMDAYFEEAEARGLALGPAFRNVESLRRGDGEATVTARLDAEGFLLHPALLDSCLRAASAADERRVDVPYLPAVWERIRIARPLPPSVTAHARLLEAGDEIRTTSLVVAGEDGVPCLVVDRLHFKRAPRAAVLSDPVDGWLHEIAWKPAAAPPPAELAGRWLVAGDGPTGAALSAALAARGAQLVHAIDGDLRGVIYLGGLEVAPTEALTAERLAGAGDACAGALRLVQELEERGATSRLFIVTRGAQAVTGAPDRLTLAAAPLLGFARVVRREQPGLTCTSVDLDPAAAPDDVRGLLAELTGREDEVAWRGGDRFVPRLRRLAPAPRPALEIPPGEQGFVVEPAERTGPNGIRVRPATPRPPGPGEVLIRVRATGVNFKDVLSSLGRFELPLGIECAGTVAAVGAGVDDLRPGDEVIATARESVARHVTAPRAHVARAPRNLPLEAAAGLPIAFLTARYGLTHLARLQAGQRVLIHAVTGGVGLAALQLARAAGAEVFALASPSKWPLCAALGVEHVLSSRARGFGDEILRRTGGQGVDVVLNSLADELMDESVAALRPGGWFVDVGASHRWDAARLAAARPGARYVQYQLTDFQHADRAGYQEELRALVDDIEAGRLAPLPTRVFPVGDAAAALRLMAQARHVGKIVLRTDPRPAPAVRPDRSYLITGGLGALGLEVAGWLASQGARHIVLAGRSPREAPAVEGVTVEQVDVSRRDDVAALLCRIAAGGPPLAGIFHAAGVLDDGVLASQTPERFARVFAGKVAGAWHLHQLTEHAELDFFVLFASQSGLVGTPGQSSYAAANTFLDALAHHRRAAGLAATSIDWGGWSGRGMAADITAHDRDARAALGLGAIAPADGLRAMDRILAGDAAQVAVLPIDWSRFARGLRRVPALLSDLAAAPRAAAPATARRPARRESLDAAGLLEAAREEVARLLGMPPERLDLARPLGELGLDSLMAVELRNRLAERTGVGLPMVAVLRRPSVQAIGEQLASATPARAEPTESKRGSLLVPLGAGAARRFFCVHGVGGGCGQFGELSSALGDSLSFVALRARGLVDGETPLTSVDAMVDAYLAEVRAAQPTGPYFLGGYCIGAIMAVEMARRLTEAGERVGLLALIDAVFLWPSPLEAGVGAAELLGNMALATARWTAAKLRRRDFADPRRYLIHLAQRLRGRPYSAAEAPPPDDATPQQEAVWRATLHAASTHTLRPYHGPILALRAREDRRFMRMLDPKLGLRRIALGGLDIVDVPGDHATLLDPPHVAALAAVLRARS